MKTVLKFFNWTWVCSWHTFKSSFGGHTLVSFLLCEVPMRHQNRFSQQVYRKHSVMNKRQEFLQMFLSWRTRTQILSGTTSWEGKAFFLPKRNPRKMRRKNRSLNSSPSVRHTVESRASRCQKTNIMGLKTQSWQWNSLSRFSFLSCCTSVDPSAFFSATSQNVRGHDAGGTGWERGWIWGGGRGCHWIVQVGAEHWAGLVCNIQGTFFKGFWRSFEFKWAWRSQRSVIRLPTK